MSDRLCPPFPTTKPASAPTPARGTPKIAAPCGLVMLKQQLSRPFSPAAMPRPAPMAPPTRAPIKVAFLAVIPRTSWTLRTSSLFKSFDLAPSESDNVVSEALIKFPLTFFPLLSFTSSLLPGVTVLRPAQSLIALVACCANVTGGSANKTARTRITADFFFLVNIKLLLPGHLFDDGDCAQSNRGSFASRIGASGESNRFAFGVVGYNSKTPPKSSANSVAPGVGGMNGMDGSFSVNRGQRD